MGRVGIGIVIVGLAALVVGGAYAYRTWDHVRHDEAFCTDCHGDEETYERLRDSEHAELGCRDCHEQSTSASLRQIRWVVDRPEEIPPHAPVLEGVCTDCHVTDDPDSTWQRISATAGHRIHLDADTVALDDVTCATCHGLQVHRFVPADRTCGQSGCHEAALTRVVLGDMAGQTGFHCITCHEFTAPVAETAPVDTARQAFIPSLRECASCHEMESVLVGLDPDVDPHDAVCGTCHDPHSQEAPEEAAERCGECHAPADDLTPFHRGIGEAVLADCAGCHDPHTFVVEGEDCVACHGDGVARAPRPSGFDHAAHEDLACADCHTSSRGHGQVAPESRETCQSCHHTAPVVDAGCERCHAASETTVPRDVDTTMEIAGRAIGRTLRFDHDDHDLMGCARCHTGGAAMEVGRTCASCHGDHPAAIDDCATCHREPAAAAHALEVHTRTCAGSSCHEDSTYGAMTQGRNTCLACHQDRVDHRPGRTCAACHGVTFASSSTAAGRDR